MNMSDWPSNEKPREKLLNHGPQALSDAELIAVVLRTGVKGCSVLDLSRGLIKKFSGIRNLLEANINDLYVYPGLGEAKCAEIKVIVEIAKRYLAETLKGGSVLTNSEETRNYLTFCLRGRAQEVFACLFLDTQCRVICYEEMFHGTVNEAQIYPREVVKRSLQLNASAVIFAHNHPSGDPTPSVADKLITERLKFALATIDVRILDHLVIGEGRVSSFAEYGWV
jgi:DNA repair protein RadC